MVMNGNGRLHHNRSMVELLRHQVHGGTGDAHAVLERLSLRVHPWKGRQQGGMDVEDAIRERIEQSWAHDPHVASKTHTVDLPSAQRLDDGLIVGVAVYVITRIHVYRFDAGRTRPHEALSR